MSETSEAVWRRRTRTPALLATAVAWAAAAWLGVGRETHPDGVHRMSSVSLPMVALMVAAMMTPLIVPALRHALARSLRRRRRRAVALQVATHGAVWLVGGVYLQVVAWSLLSLLGPVLAPLTVLTTAVVWHLTPIAQKCLNQHHAHPPLAAFGPTADRDLLSFGTRHAAYCLGACWALMLLPALCGPYSFIVMLLASVWVWALALETPTQPRWCFRVPVRAGRLVASQLRTLAARTAQP
jgi:predicted metal-binding membrane protein